MPLHPRRSLTVIPTLLAAQLALADAPAPVRPDREPFDGASPEQRIALVLSALDARDRELANFRYALRETCTNINVKNGSRRFMVQSEYEMRRLAPTLWMHVVTHKFGEKDKDDEIETDRIVSWDGKTGIQFGTPQNVGQREHTAFTDTQESNEFLNRKFNALLGLRIQVDNAGVPLADFLRSAAHRGDPITVGRDSRNLGALQIKVEVRRENDRWAFWLDPAHGNMLSRLEHRYERGQDYMASHEEVLVPVEVNGVWVPREAVHVTGTSGFHEESEFRYRVTSFEIGTVKPADVAIPFPVGTMVTDTVNKKAYEVLPDGKKKMLPPPVK